MEVHLKGIASLFSPDSQWHIRKFEETFESVHIEFVLGECDYGSDSLNDEPDFLVPERDAISINLLEDGELIANYYPVGTGIILWLRLRERLQRIIAYL